MLSSLLLLVTAVTSIRVTAVAEGNSCNFMHDLLLDIQLSMEMQIY